MSAKTKSAFCYYINNNYTVWWQEVHFQFTVSSYYTMQKWLPEVSQIPGVKANADEDKDNARRETMPPDQTHYWDTPEQRFSTLYSEEPFYF